MAKPSGSRVGCGAGDAAGELYGACSMTNGAPAGGLSCLRTVPGAAWKVVVPAELELDMSFAMTEAPIATAIAADAASAITRPFGTPLPLSVCLASISVSSCRLVGLVDRRHELRTSSSTPSQTTLKWPARGDGGAFAKRARSQRPFSIYSTREMINLPPDLITGDPEIDNLDVTTIVTTVRIANNWSASKALEAEKWYRRFLFLTKQEHKHGDVVAVFGLDKDADLIWHEHITSTKQYQSDSAKIFGEGQYLHHTPTTPPNWKVLLEAAMALYEKKWHEIPPYANICCI